MQVAGIEFPPKSVFGSFESTIIQNRIDGITAWFETVLSTPGLKDCHEVCGFLGVPPGEASPVSIVHGKQDKLMPVEHAHSCAKGCVGAELFLVDEMGHELVSFGPGVQQPIIDAIGAAAGRAGLAATGPGGAEPEPEPKTRSV